MASRRSPLRTRRPRNPGPRAAPETAFEAALLLRGADERPRIRRAVADGVDPDAACDGVGDRLKRRDSPIVGTVRQQHDDVGNISLGTGLGLDVGALPPALFDPPAGLPNAEGVAEAPSTALATG